jgi:beta-glucanase (GH16 family)
VSEVLIPGFDATTQFHRYGVDWREDTIGWFIDDIEVFRMETAFREPAYLLLDVAVGGWAGQPDFSSGSTDMVVRSVKVFQ